MRMGELAGLEQLIRTDEPSPSLLDGDGGFLTPLQSNLHRLIDRTKESDDTARADSPRVDLQLSATLVQPIVEHVNEVLDRDRIQRLDRLANELLEHPEVRGGAESTVDDETLST